MNALLKFLIGHGRVFGLEMYFAGKFLTFPAVRQLLFVYTTIVYRTSIQTQILSPKQLSFCLITTFAGLLGKFFIFLIALYSSNIAINSTHTNIHIFIKIGSPNTCLQR